MGVRSAQEHEWDGEPVDDRAQDKEIHRRAAVFPSCAVQAQQQLPWGKLHQQQGQEDLGGELLILHSAFHAPLLGFGGAGAWQVGTQITVIDALGYDQREDDIDDALERIDAEKRNAGFELVGEFCSLWAGGFWEGHITRTPPLVVPVEQRSHIWWF